MQKINLILTDKSAVSKTDWLIFFFFCSSGVFPSSTRIGFDERCRTNDGDDSVFSFLSRPVVWIIIFAKRRANVVCAKKNKRFAAVNDGWRSETQKRHGDVAFDVSKKCIMPLSARANDVTLPAATHSKTVSSLKLYVVSSSTRIDCVAVIRSDRRTCSALTAIGDASVLSN